MLVYEGSKAEFMKDVESDLIASKVEQRVLGKLGRHTPKSELRSWENSMQHMYKVLSDIFIPSDAGVAIEYNIPQTSKRVDFIISGYDSDGKPNFIIVELKQWEEINAVDGSDSLVETYIGGAVRRTVHPSYQAWSYASLIGDYNQSVQDNDVKLNPCAYLHNYSLRRDDPIVSDQYSLYTEEAPVFAKGQVYGLRKFIVGNISRGDNGDLLHEMDSGKIRPSKSLQNAIGSMLQGNREFVMIDDQKVAYDIIIDYAARCTADNRKRTIIVEGGPGTGKSVIAVNLLVELTRKGQFAQYISKNSAPRTVYAKKLKGVIKKSSVDNLFKGSGIFTEADANIVNTIIVDEAHRLNAKSGMFQNLGENQIKEIIHAGRCSVFFIDESQRVTLSDIGSVEEIERWAEKESSEVIRLQLTSQFRCNGSDGYLAWLDDVLEIRETANYDLKDANYDFRVIGSASELRKLIEEKNDENHRSRMLAGYCWNWNGKEKNNSDYYDIVIDDFKMSWNLGNSIFAIDDSSINEVGCIHTSQGLEFDYVGVIIGPDIRFDGEHIVTDFTERAKTDQSLKGIKKMYNENPLKANYAADEIIKNTYRTLMTRGMKGCYVYCVDERLAEYLKSRIG